MKTLTRSFVVLCCLSLAGTSFAGESEAPLKLSDGVSCFKLDDFTMDFHMRLQGWGGYVGDDALLTNGDRMQEPGFRLRRARLGVAGQLFNGMEYKLELDLFDEERNGGPLYEAYMTYSPNHWFGTTLGVQKFLFVKSEMMSSGFLPFLDRPMGSTAMSPGNTMGLAVFTQPWDKHLKLTLGVFNGLHRSNYFHQGYDGVGVTLGNRWEGLSYAGRLDIEPLSPIGKNLADLKQSRDFRIALGGSGFYNDGGTITSMGYSGYLHLKWYGFYLFGEYVSDRVKPLDRTNSTGTINVTMDRWVANGSLGYVFLKDMMGLAVRFEMLDSNVDVENEGDEWAITAALTWYVIGDFLKAQLEYTHREEMHGLVYDNDSAIAGATLMF